MNIIPTKLVGRSLSTRELQILQMLAEGCTKAVIAERLYVSVGTVRTIGCNLFTKLGATSAAQAVSAGYRLGYLAVDPDVAEDLAVIRSARELGYRLAVIKAGQP